MHGNTIANHSAIKQLPPSLTDNGPILSALDAQQNLLDSLGLAMSNLESRLAAVLTFANEGQSCAEGNSSPSHSIVHSKVESANERISLITQHIESLNQRITL